MRTRENTILAPGSGGNGHPHVESASERRNVPVRKVKGGFQYGSSGKVYRGKGAKSRASKQGRAIQANKKKK
jgi:hypothetical protein